MFKNMMLGAFVAIAACAGAQDKWWGDETRTGVDATGKTHSDILHSVCRQDQYLSGGDAYDFETMLYRLPSTIEDALVSGLFAAHRQSVLVRDEIIAARFNTDTDVLAMTTGGDQVILAQETENSMRPMRMVMREDPSRDINYDRAFDILTTDLNNTQETQLGRWWFNNANEHDKDIIVRLLKIDARRADDPIYPSLYMHFNF
jgi:hypothetical protein